MNMGLRPPRMAIQWHTAIQRQGSDSASGKPAAPPLPPVVRMGRT